MLVASNEASIMLMIFSDNTYTYNGFYQTTSRVVGQTLPQLKMERSVTHKTIGILTHA